MQGRYCGVLRREWEMGTRDLRLASRIDERGRFNRAVDDLQKTFKVIPSDVIYKPTFSYIWSLAESRFHDELALRVSREEAIERNCACLPERCRDDTSR